MTDVKSGGERARAYRRSMSAAAILAVTAGASAQNPAPSADPTVWAANRAVCQGGTLSPIGLAAWFYYNIPAASKNFDSPEAFRAALARRPDAVRAGQPDQATQAVNQALTLVQGVEIEGFDVVGFFAGSAGAPPACPAPKAAVAGDAAAASPSWPAGIRLRGAPDALVTARDDPAFSSTAGASLSVSGNGAAKTTASTLEAAVGYAFGSGGAGLSVIPMASVDRNYSETSGKPSSADRENVTVGAILEYQSVGNVFKRSAQNIVEATGEHLWNDISKSQLNYLQVLDKPYWAGILNWPTGAGSVLASLLVDARADLGEYSDRGSVAPSQSKHFEQFGGSIGVALNVPSMGVSFSVMELLMAQALSGRKEINLFDTSVTYAFPGQVFGVDKALGLKASFENGILEATGQRSEQWSLSVSAKF